MKNLLSLFFSFVLITASVTPSTSFAALNGTHREVQYGTSAGGRGYTEARKIPSNAPAIALGVATVALIIAVGLYKQGSAHSH